jgi:hypothetical protein
MDQEASFNEINNFVGFELYFSSTHLFFQLFVGKVRINSFDN